jgi:carbamoyl-phosphate synthase large subunit
MERDINVLVIGVGGNVTQGILKALAVSRLQLNVVAAGVHPMDFGLHTPLRAYVCPWAHEAPFYDWLVGVCRDERIDIILTGAEPVVRFLAAHQEEIQTATGAIGVVSTPEVVAIGDDKFGTCAWLEHHGFAAPACVLSEDGEGARRLAQTHGYPLIVKPRYGGGSRGLFVIDDDHGLAYAVTRKDYVIQQCVGAADDEYTVGCFADRDGRLMGTIVLKRELHEGTTGRAVAGAFPEIAREAAAIAAALKPRGPCNIQMRVHQGRPVCFEMNVRFSGTSPVRARLGFNEAEAAIRHFLLGESFIALPATAEGRVVRYLNELYINEQAYQSLRTHGARLHPGTDSGAIEDFGMQ